MKKRIFSFLMALVMVFSILPLPAMAAEDGLCHLAHTADCGFVQAVAGVPCAHAEAGCSLGTVDSILISDGTVTAKSGNGIGTGKLGSVKTILITGGTVTATGVYLGAGIGSANNSHVDTISITGGTVTATSETYGAGIGSGGQRAVPESLNVSGYAQQDSGRYAVLNMKIQADKKSNLVRFFYARIMKAI